MREAILVVGILAGLFAVAGLAASFANAAEGGGDDDGIAFQVSP